jgi:uncharacterized RDD family membrane protein YckC
MDEATQQKWIAGFWRRIGALFIDTLILGLLGFLLGLAFENAFVQTGGWGRLIGFVIALVYFGIMNSALCQGQTIGKRILKIRVVGPDGHPISLVRSLFRYIVFAVPFSLNGAQLPSDILFSLWIYPLSLIVFGGLFSIIYLYLFNRVTRQSLHDLAVGTFVANARVEKQETSKVWRVHLVVVAALFLISATVPAITGRLAKNETFKGMLDVQSALSRQPLVTYATVSINTTTFDSEDNGVDTATYVAIQAFISSNKIDDVKLAQKLAGVVVENFPEAMNNDGLIITLTHGYDIGIWSQWSNHTYDFNPIELEGAR